MASAKSASAMDKNLRAGAVGGGGGSSAGGGANKSVNAASSATPTIDGTLTITPDSPADVEWRARAKNGAMEEFWGDEDSIGKSTNLRFVVCVHSFFNALASRINPASVVGIRALRRRTTVGFVR